MEATCRRPAGKPTPSRMRHRGAMDPDLLPVLREEHDQCRLAAAIRRLEGSEHVMARWDDGAVAYLLIDLSSPSGDDAVGAALCGHQEAGGEVWLLALALHPAFPGALNVLVSGVADALRARGAHRLVAAFDPSDRTTKDGLVGAGLRVDADPSAAGRRLMLDL